jgi:hypothetical protein
MASSWTTPCLISIIVLQWILFTVLLQFAREGASSTATAAMESAMAPTDLDRPAPVIGTAALVERSGRDALEDTLEGVAATIMFRAPKWFLLRYKVMLDNALANLPNDATWKVQVFVNEKWVKESVLPWHPGLERMLTTNPRVIVTSLSTDLVGHGKKPRDVLLSTWFWEHMAADRVVLFSGNGAFCGNPPFTAVVQSTHHPVPGEMATTSMTTATAPVTTAWHELLSLDYVGVPSSEAGGDGSSHSLRYRPAMLRALRYHELTTESKRSIDGPEHRFFLDTLQKMNEHAVQLQLVPSPTESSSIDQKSKTNKHYRQLATDSSVATTQDQTLVPLLLPLFSIATVPQTILWGGTTNLSGPERLVHLPLVVAGTQARLSYAERDSLLKHCPELKVIFPSLHEPSCFGAHPDGAACKATICALQDPVPSHGC